MTELRIMRNSTGWNVVGVILILAGIALGFYVGGYLMLLGGIVDVINAIKAPVTEAYPVAMGILKMLLSPIVGTLAGLFLIYPGGCILKNA